LQVVAGRRRPITCLQTQFCNNFCHFSPFSCLVIPSSLLAGRHLGLFRLLFPESITVAVSVTKEEDEADEAKSTKKSRLTAADKLLSPLQSAATKRKTINEVILYTQEQTPDINTIPLEWWKPVFHLDSGYRGETGVAGGEPTEPRMLHVISRNIRGEFLNSGGGGIPPGNRSG
jgi:hypothetical protein